MLTGNPQRGILTNGEDPDEMLKVCNDNKALAYKWSVRYICHVLIDISRIYINYSIHIHVLVTILSNGETNCSLYHKFLLYEPSLTLLRPIDFSTAFHGVKFRMDHCFY